jgi:hypothetical protein
MAKEGKMKKKLIAAMALAVVLLSVNLVPVHAVQSAPILVPGNPTADTLGLAPFSCKVEPPISGTYGLDASLGGTNTVTVTVSPDGLTFDWSSSLPIDAIIVKGGPNADLYLYDPEAFSNSGEPALHPPVNPNNGLYYAIAHIEFAFDYEVAVSTTATPSFRRTYEWRIDKTSSTTELTLSEGQVYDLPFTVTAAVIGHADGHWRVAGTVWIHNPSPFPAFIAGVDDVLAGVPASVDFNGILFPCQLAPGSTLTGTYGVPFASNPGSGTNAVVVATTGGVGPGTASASFDFASASIVEADARVTVADDHAGQLGTTTAAAAPQVFSYSGSVGPYATNGVHTYTNIASFVTNDSSTTGNDSWTVFVDIPSPACTLSQGYWKTHSEFGPARYDDVWSLLPSGAGSAFFSSGKSYYQVLRTPPQGNIYYVLAQAYIAAELNSLNGADLAAVKTGFDEARALLGQYTPAQVVLLKGKGGIDLRARFAALATTLDQYNTGVIGPGACDEDGS